MLLSQPLSEKTTSPQQNDIRIEDGTSAVKNLTIWITRLFNAMEDTSCAYNKLQTGGRPARLRLGFARVCSNRGFSSCKKRKPKVIFHFELFIFPLKKWRGRRDWRSFAVAHRSRPDYRPSVKQAFGLRGYPCPLRMLIRTGSHPVGNKKAANSFEFTAFCLYLKKKVAGTTGFEPATTGSTVRCANQLRHVPAKVRVL